jgi:hypothetical protein
MTDRKDDENLSALEAEVEAARTRLSDSLQNLTRPSISETVKHDIRTYAETVKDQVVEKIGSTRDQLMSNARDAARRQAHSMSESLRERAAANPLALVLIGAGIGWRLYQRPPIATLLVGAGAAGLLMNSSRRSAGRHFEEYHDPYRREHAATYVPGGVAGYGYPIQEKAPAPTMRERAEQLGETVEQTTSRVRETAGELAAQVSNKASDLATRVSEAADAGRARVADAASEVRREVSHYGRAARRELSGHRGRYGMLLGAIGLSLAAVAVGATRVAAARSSQATPGRRQAESASEDGSFSTSEDAFIAKLRDSDPTDRSFIQDSAIATEDIVGDTEPATRGGELRDGSEPESSLKARGRKRASSSE